jgi:HPt (histidine-containing phosphotransfer) domain-containing protein
MGLDTEGSDERPDMILDLERLTTNCNGNINIVRQLLTHLYQKSGPKWISGLEAAVADGSGEKLREICHGMKGASATVFAWRISNLALDLEKLARDDKVEELGDRLTELKGAFDELVRWMDDQPELGRDATV